VIDSGAVDSGAIDSDVIDSDVIESDVIESDVIESDVIDSDVIDSDVIDSGIGAGLDALGSTGCARPAAGPSVRCSSPEKICRHTPHRTSPRRSFNWSATTLKVVWHFGQRVASVIAVPVSA
jgi:hypothetical protein